MTDYTLTLDEGDEHMFKHELTGYGTVLIGGDAENRESEMLRHMDEPVAVVDGRDVDDERDFWVQVIRAALGDAVPDDYFENQRTINSRNGRRALMEADSGVLVVEFDEMDSDTQTDVARGFKGVAENMNFEQEIGFTASEGNPVVRAERDLSMRVRTWELEPEDGE